MEKSNLPNGPPVNRGANFFKNHMNKRTLLLFLFFIFFNISCLFAYENEITYRKPYPSTSANFDPAVITDGINLFLSNQIFDHLFEFDELLSVKPNLALRWEADPTGYRYKIFLRKGIKFHNGTILTANDVVFSLNRLMSKKSVISQELTLIKSIKASKDDVVEIELNSPFPLFIQMLASPWAAILPDKFANETESYFFKRPIGTGAFSMFSYEPGKKVVLKSNSDYFLGKPKIDKIILENPLVGQSGDVLDGSSESKRKSAIKGFNNKYFHDLEWFTPDPNELTTNYKVIKEPASTTNVLAMNLRVAPFNNIHYRRAFNFAINKAKLLEICGNGGILATGYIPPGLPAHQNVSSNSNVYDPVSAKKELAIYKASTGTSQIRGITILRPDNYSCQKQFSDHVEMGLKSVGINAKVQHVPFSSLIESYYKPRNFDAINISYTADFPEPFFMLNYFRSDGPKNFSGLKSKEFDEILKQISKTEDKYARYNLYQQAQEILEANAAIVNIYHPINSVFYNVEVSGVSSSPLAIFMTSMRSVKFDK